MDSKEKITNLFSALSDTACIHLEMFPEQYKENLWYLEICSDYVSKYDAVLFLRERYGFERVVGFGDNLNDLSMFEACDECYATFNAKAEVKQKADEVINSNEEDGVVQWLEEHRIYTV